MNKATYPLKLPISIKTAAAKLAKEDGVSLNQWIAAAVAEKVGAVETAADFFKRRRARLSQPIFFGFWTTLRRMPPSMTIKSGKLARCRRCIAGCPGQSGTILALPRALQA